MTGHPMDTGKQYILIENLVLVVHCGTLCTDSVSKVDKVSSG